MLESGDWQERQPRLRQITLENVLDRDDGQRHPLIDRFSARGIRPPSKAQDAACALTQKPSIVRAGVATIAASR
jgi:hypothetical protein